MVRTPHLFLNSLGWDLLDGNIIAIIPHLTSIPLRRGDWVNSELIHRIDLLQAAVLGFDDEEEDNEDQRSTASGKDQSVEVSDVASDESSEERHEEVPQPVACGGESHARSTVAGWVQFSNHGPDFDVVSPR